MSEYNGWTNKETWLVTLWLMPEIEEYVADLNGPDITSSLSHYAYSTSMQNMGKKIEEYVGTRVFHNLSDEVGEDDPNYQVEIGGLTSDLLRMCLHDVNWYEIAEHVRSDAEENYLWTLEDAVGERAEIDAEENYLWTLETAKEFV